MFAVDVFAASKPAELRVDYAYYNPLSLVIKKFNWLEKEFQPDNVRIRWVYSSSSNLALGYVKADSLDMAASAGVSSVWSRANGNPVKAVYVFARPELSALLVSRESPIQSVKELKGKTVATFPGSAPYFFLLRALSDVGLHKNDVEIVPLEHAEGRAALEQHKVDAWSSIQPFTTLSRLENGSREIYRNIMFNAVACLVVSEDFARKYPDAVSRIIRVYERARKWALRHPDDLEVIYADETKLSLPVSRTILSRYDFLNPVIDRNDLLTLKQACAVLIQEQEVRPGADLDKVINDLIDRSFIVKEISTDERLK